MCVCVLQGWIGLPSLVEMKNKMLRENLEPFGNIREALEVGLVVGRQMAMDGRQHWDLASELRIKVRGIGWSADLGEEWWRHFLVQNILPVHTLEERVALDLLSVRLAASKTLLRITSQQLLHKRISTKRLAYIYNF